MRYPGAYSNAFVDFFPIYSTSTLNHIPFNPRSILHIALNHVQFRIYLEPHYRYSNLLPGILVIMQCAGGTKGVTLPCYKARCFIRLATVRREAYTFPGGEPNISDTTASRAILMFWKEPKMCIFLGITCQRTVIGKTR